MTVRPTANLKVSTCVPSSSCWAFSMRVSYSLPPWIRGTSISLAQLVCFSGLSASLTSQLRWSTNLQGERKISSLPFLGEFLFLFTWSMNSCLWGLLCMLVDVEKASSSKVQLAFYVHRVHICRFNQPRTEHSWGKDTLYKTCFSLSSFHNQ